jgi:hypothetical protein
MALPARKLPSDLPQNGLCQRPQHQCRVSCGSCPRDEGERIVKTDKKVSQYVVHVGSWGSKPVVRVVRSCGWMRTHYRVAARNGIDPVIPTSIRGGTGFRVVRVKGDSRHGV